MSETPVQMMRVTVTFEYPVNLDEAESDYGTTDPREIASYDEACFRQGRGALHEALYTADYTVRVDPVSADQSSGEDTMAANELAELRDELRVLVPRLQQVAERTDGVLAVVRQLEDPGTPNPGARISKLDPTLIKMPATPMQARAELLRIQGVARNYRDELAAHHEVERVFRRQHDDDVAKIQRVVEAVETFGDRGAIEAVRRLFNGG